MCFDVNQGSKCIIRKLTTESAEKNADCNKNRTQPILDYSQHCAR